MAQDCKDLVHVTSCLSPENRTSVVEASPSGLVTRPQDGFISDTTFHTTTIVLHMTLLTITAIVGILSNTLNIVVFKKHGLKDSITIGLFSLSVSDLFIVLFQLLYSVAYIIDHLQAFPTVHAEAIAAVTVVPLRFMFYNISCTLTVFLSMERCFCVAKPLTVKTIFTRERAIMLVCSTFMFYIIGWIPKLFATQLRWQTRPGRHSDELLTLWYHPSFDHIEAYHNTVMTIFVPTAIQIIITVTAVIMIRALRKASQFRMKATGKKQRNETPDIMATGEKLNNAAPVQQTGVKPGLDPREARLVKTVVILVVVLFVTNAPYIAIEYAQLFVPAFRPGKLYGNLFIVLIAVILLLGAINASINAIVYYKTGSKYRQTVRDIIFPKRANEII